MLNRSVSSTVNIILSLYIYIDLSTLSLVGKHNFCTWVLLTVPVKMEGNFCAIY